MKQFRLWRYRDAALSLAWLNLRLRYNNTLLGAAWSLVNPLFHVLILTFVFTQLLPNGVPDYPIFILSALLAWNYFQAALMGVCNSIINGRGLITKVAFPRAILPLAALLTELVTFLLALSVLLVVMSVVGRGIGAGWWALPILIALISGLALGMGLLLAVMNVRLRDTRAFLEVFLFGWFFMSPILYNLNQIPVERMVLGISARTLIQIINPLSGVITAFRQAIYEARFPDLDLLWGSGAAAVLLLIVGAVVFGRVSHRFAEHL